MEFVLSKLFLLWLIHVVNYMYLQEVVAINLSITHVIHLMHQKRFFSELSHENPWQDLESKSSYVTTLIEYNFVKTYTWWKRNHQMSAVRVEIQLALASIVCYHGPQCISVIYWNLLEKWGHCLSTSYSSTIYVTAENAEKNFDFSYTDLK